EFPEPFGWLNAAWKQTARPAHRPFAPLACYQLAHAVGALEAAGVPPEKVLELLATPDGRRRQQIWETLPQSARRFLGRDPTVGLPSTNRVRLEEAVRWARRQWTNPMARVRGERPILRDHRRGVTTSRIRSSQCPKCGGGSLSRKICQDQNCGWG